MEAYDSERASFRAGFAANVRRLRAASIEPLSQEELSLRTGLHRTVIGKIEQGTVEPRLSTLVILAEGLGVSLNELVAGLPVPRERKPSPQARRRQLEA